MSSCLESFSTELLFETFKYLFSSDLFQAFIGLNHRLDTIIGLYPLRLNFQSIPRSKFDFVCRRIRPEQVISLLLSEEHIPDQVNLFMQYFPHFEHQFIRLQSLKFIRTGNFISNLPCCVSSLLFEKCFLRINIAHIYVDCIDLIPSNNIRFLTLTHLAVASFCRIDQLDEMIQTLNAPITNLNVSIKSDFEEIASFPSKLEKMCQSLMYLKYLTIILDNWIQISFESIEQCLNKLSKLTHLTIEATGTLDLLDGARWEELVSRKRLAKFIFKFSHFSDYGRIGISLLEPFRSPFWLKEKCWYVAHHEEDCWDCKLSSVYSVPYFLPRVVQYPMTGYPPLSTAPPNVEKRLFYDRRIDHLELISRNPEYGDILTRIVDLSQVQMLDILSFDNMYISTLGLCTLLSHTPRLNHLMVRQYGKPFILPSHVRSLSLKSGSGAYPINSSNIDRLCHELFHIEHLEVEIPSEEIMIKVIDRFDRLDSIIFESSNSSLLKTISTNWFQQNTRSLKANNFTWRIASYYQRYSSERERSYDQGQHPEQFIYLSIARDAPTEEPCDLPPFEN